MSSVSGGRRREAKFEEPLPIRRPIHRYLRVKFRTDEVHCRATDVTPDRSCDERLEGVDADGVGDAEDVKVLKKRRVRVS